MDDYSSLKLLHKISQGKPKLRSDLMWGAAWHMLHVPLMQRKSNFCHHPISSSTHFITPLNTVIRMAICYVRWHLFFFHHYQIGITFIKRIDRYCNQHQQSIPISESVNGGRKENSKKNGGMISILVFTVICLRAKEESVRLCVLTVKTFTFLVHILVSFIVSFPFFTSFRVNQVTACAHYFCQATKKFHTKALVDTRI